MAAGTGGTILASTDGGATWESRASGTTDNLWGVACPTTKDCLVGSMHGVLVSTDGGTTWPGGTAGLDAMLSGVSCPSASTCVAVGSVVDKDHGLERGRRGDQRRRRCQLDKPEAGHDQDA